MRKQYSTPIVEKITFDYKVQTSSASQCYESVMNERPAGGDSRTCESGTPISMGWTTPQTYIDG